MQNSTLRVGESHARTATKTVVYRILSTIAVYFLCLALGITSKGAGTLATIALVFGIFAYYTHDRVWNRINWRRNQDCKESNLRSITKTVTYRIVILIVSGVITRLVATDSNTVAATFAILNLVINMTLYYILERVANVIRRQRSHV
jgi:uncharacterized membrane protein